MASTLGKPARPSTAKMVADERTDRFEPIAGPDDRFRHEGGTADPVLPGRYIQVHGPDQRLIRLGDEVVHIGRGLAANRRPDRDRSGNAAVSGRLAQRPASR